MSPIHIHNFELWHQDEPAYDPGGYCENIYGIVEVTYWKWMPGDITLTIDTVLKKISNLNMPYMLSTSIDGNIRSWWNRCEDRASGIVEIKKKVYMDGFPDTPQTPKAPVMTRAKVAGYEGCELEADIYSTDNHIMPSHALYYKIYADGKLLGDKELIFTEDDGDNSDNPKFYYWDHPDREIYTDSYLFREDTEVNAWLTYFRRSDGTPGLRKIFIPFSFDCTTAKYPHDEHGCSYDSLCEDYSTLYATLVLINPDGTQTESEPAYLQEGGIEGIATDREIGEQPVYDLTGRRVSHDNLAPGIYISGGQKFIVK